MATGKKGEDIGVTWGKVHGRVVAVTVLREEKVTAWRARKLNAELGLPASGRVQPGRYVLVTTAGRTKRGKRGVCGTYLIPAEDLR